MNSLREYIETNTPVLLSRRKVRKILEAIEMAATIQQLDQAKTIKLPAELIATVLKNPATTTNNAVRDFLDEYAPNQDGTQSSSQIHSRVGNVQRTYLGASLARVGETVHYLFYSSVMQRLGHQALPKNRWVYGNRVIHDAQTVRQPASDRWQLLIQNGTKVGHLVRRIPHESTAWGIRDITPSCMVTLAIGRDKMDVGPGALQPWRKVK